MRQLSLFSAQARAASPGDLAGLAPTLLGPRVGGPALRIASRRRITRLAELIGDPPPATPPGRWP
ncbi:MAG: hypothetical protein ACRDRP_05295 [Pseudonocardiaceae bacterium]